MRIGSFCLPVCSLKWNLADFDDAIRVFGKQESVRLYNHSKLRDLQVPVIIVTADHTGHPRAKNASTDEAGNLQASFALSINAKVMLLENLWTTQGLVNGRMGYVRDIFWGRHVVNPRKEPPTVLLIYFPGYNGPCYKEVNGEKLVPIFRSRRDFSHGSKACTRTQFPLVLAYAITVHKSQGISLDQAVLNITDKEFAPGLTYVAVSRVRSLDGLLFEQSFDFSRFKPRKSTIKQMRHEDAIRRSKQEIPLPGEEPEEPQGGDELPEPSSHPSLDNMLGMSEFDIPIRRSSPVPGYSDPFGSADLGMSEAHIPPSGDGDVGTGGSDDVDMGGGGDGNGDGDGDNIPDYDTDWLVDEQSQTNPYFDCRRCHTWRPSHIRWDPYNVCEYCHFN
jgi:hypothetical protein